MVKSRMTALDVRASVEEMRTTLVGLRLLNIYDLNDKKMFLLKFGHGENKRTVVLENGVRIHLTDLVREKPKIPSQFTLGLRKLVRAWRLDSVVQLQHDRTIDMCFGVSAEEGKSFHILIELFGKGNIILTDHAYMIRVLLRSHKDADVTLRVGSVYPAARPFEHSDSASPAAAMAEAAAGDAATRQQRLDFLREAWNVTWSRNGDDESIRSTLSGVNHFGPALADHILAITGVPNQKKKDVVADPEGVFADLSEGMLLAWGITSMSLPPGGYLIQNGGGKKAKKDTVPQPKADGAEASEETAAAAATGTTVVVSDRYDDFTPVLLAQFEKSSVTKTYMESFGKVCDTFFLPTEFDKIASHNDKNEKKAESKREKFERDHQRRLSALEREQQINHRKGELLMFNADAVDEAIALINGALATGIQWDELKVVLRRRHADGHPVAYMIHELALEKNSISVLLEQHDLYDDEDAVDVEPEVVEVDLSKTAHANASVYFAKKKANRTKYDKTVAATDKASAGAARKAERVASKKDTKKQLVKERSRPWWEKLFWFRTSAGDIVLRGKDTQTTELLIRRTMRIGDIFVHCDVAEALPCLIRPMQSAYATENGSPSSTSAPAVAAAVPVSLKSIEEAGAWCVSRSAAWENKQSIGAWWVYASQIIGGTATGCYLHTGERHTILPQPLALGCGLLFTVARTVAVGSDGAAPAELPNLVVHTARATSEEEGDQGVVGVDCVPADCAEQLSSLPSVEALRKEQRKSTQRGGPSTAKKATTTSANVSSSMPKKGSGGVHVEVAVREGVEVPVAAAQEAEELAKPAPQLFHKDRKTKKRNKYFTSSDAQQQPHRNARANNPNDAAGKKRRSQRDDSESDNDDNDDAQSSSTLPSQKQPQPLTRQQKKKLKKIQEKYGDQDEEDRVRGAMLNGNQISRVQAREIELQAARERAEQLLKQQEEKAARETLKAHGKLRYRAATAADEEEDQEDHDGDDVDDDIEEVSDFSEDAEGHTGGESDAEAASAEEEEEEEEKEMQETGGAEDDASADDQETSESNTTATASAHHSSPHANTNLAPQVLVAAQASDEELKKVAIHYTCCPTAEDVVGHVVCVCAPLSTLVSCGYTYRIELVCAVAQSKKGHVAQVVMDQFLQAQKRSAAAAAAATTMTTGSDVTAAAAAADVKGRASTSANRKKGAASAVLVPTSASLLAEMQHVGVADVVEQLRGEVKPLHLKSN